MGIQNDIRWLLPLLSALATFDSTVITSQSEYIILFFILACVNSTAKLTISHFIF